MSINAAKEVHNKKFEDAYKEKWIEKCGYDDLDCYAWRTSVYQEYDSYEQGWADNLQKTSEDWANPVRSPEQYTEAKYDEKIGKTICWFFKKGYCKKGKN